MRTKKYFWQSRGIFPAITTTIGSDWKEKMKEADNLGLKDVCVFLTGLEKEARREFYRLLEKTKIKRTPLVHIRTDMEPQEIEYFKRRFKAETFNCHTPREVGFSPDLKKYKKDFFIENTRFFAPGDENGFAGFCIDFSHLESARLMNPQTYKKWTDVFKGSLIGCNHISAIRKQPETDPYGFASYDSHLAKNFGEFDYLERYPAGYFSSVMALELENTLAEQLKIIEHVNKLLKNKK